MQREFNIDNLFGDLYRIIGNEVGGTRVLEALVNWDYDVEEYNFLYEIVNYQFDTYNEVMDILYDYGDMRAIDSTIDKVLRDNNWR
jgi:hypothetical protein